MTKRATLALLIAFPLAVGAVAAMGSDTRPAIGGKDGQNAPRLLTEPYEYTSDEGGFKVMWPSGCGELRRREPNYDPDADPFEIVYVSNVYCDQFGQHGRGCAVTSIVNLKGPDGGPPGPAEVVSRMEEHMQTLSVNVVKQTAVQKAMPNGTVIEGLDIRAKPPNSGGEAWLRGLLYEGQIFLLSAWNIEGELWEDPEIQAFFNSFEPLIE